MTYFSCHDYDAIFISLIKWKIQLTLMNKNPSTYTQISTPVLQILKDKFKQYEGTPFCFVQISHRSKFYEQLNNLTVEVIKKYLNAEDYEVLLMPSGSAMSSIYFNLVQPNSNLIFYSQGDFSNQYYDQMKKYYPQCEKLSDWEAIRTIVQDQAHQNQKIIHYNKIENGFEITNPIFNQQERKKFIFVKNINYCFPWIDNSPMTEDIVYFDTERGFCIPGFTVTLIKKSLIKNIELKEKCPDMFDFLLMLKMKSVVNTPFTLCTFVLYQNIKYALQNKSKMVESICLSKMVFQQFFRKLRWQKTADNCSDGSEKYEAYNFVRISFKERESDILEELKSYGWIEEESKTFYFYIQNQNLEPMFNKLKIGCEDTEEEI